MADFPDARFELLDGEADPLSGIRIVPTPGHVPGHQSLVVDYTASFTSSATSASATGAPDAPQATTDHAVATTVPTVDARAPRPFWKKALEWIGRFHEFDPWRVLFAHDLAIWERPGPAT